MTTFNDYIIRLYGGEKHEALRLGQWAFNLLHEMNPGLANAIRATKLDPFYLDDRIEAFLVEVAEKWEQYNHELDLSARLVQEQKKMEELGYDPNDPEIFPKS